MTRTPMMVRVDEDVRAGMDALKDRDGVPFNEQINRALRAWLEQKGVLKKSAKR
jgi:uncharacterized protein (DUF4415 family)